MRFVILSLVVWVILTVFTVVFAGSASGSEVRVLKKPIWIILIIGLPVIGALLYLTIGRPIGKPVTSQIAPDDDPEFLRRLAERFKKDDENDDDEDRND